MHKKVVYDTNDPELKCGGELEWEYIFLESPSDLLEIVTKAVRWKNKNKPENDIEGKRCWDSIYSYNGALARKDSVLKKLKKTQSLRQEKL